MKLFLRIQRGLLLLLLFCYPKAYRICFGKEIYQISKRLLEEAATAGWGALLSVSMRELWGLLSGLFRERLIVWFGELHPMQRFVLRAIIAYLALLGLIAVVLQYAANPSRQAIQGLIIGDYYDQTRPTRPIYISGKRMACQPSEKEAYSERCTITLAGQQLTVYGIRNPPMQFVAPGGLCEAWYMNEQRPCSMAFRHMAPWHAMLPDGLGLSQEQSQAIRRAHPIENIDETTIFTIVMIIPVVTAVLISILLGLFHWAPRRRVRVLALVELAVFAFMLWFFTLLSFMFLTNDFWD